jgi:hypothetical protein
MHQPTQKNKNHKPHYYIWQISKPFNLPKPTSTNNSKQDLNNKLDY